MMKNNRCDDTDNNKMKHYFKHQTKTYTMMMMRFVCPDHDDCVYLRTSGNCFGMKFDTIVKFSVTNFTWTKILRHKWDF